MAGDLSLPGIDTSVFNRTLEGQIVQHPHGYSGIVFSVVIDIDRGACGQSASFGHIVQSFDLSLDFFLGPPQSKSSTLSPISYLFGPDGYTTYLA